MSPPSNPTPAAIDAFVKQVIGWSHVLQMCADGALERAHVQFAAGDIGFADYNDALQQKLAVVKSCVDMTNAAGSVLLVIAEAEMRPVVDATKKLEEASQTLAGIQDGVVIVAGLAVAAAALAIAIGGYYRRCGQLSLQGGRRGSDHISSRLTGPLSSFPSTAHAT